MNNPWEDIRLCDYENHMKSHEVMQLQFLNRMTEMQLKECKYRTLAILGVAGGNGLEYVKADDFDKVYGIDVNSDYLEVCKERYESELPIFEAVCADLKNEKAKMSELSGFLDTENRLIAFPSKQKTKIKALFYIAEKLEKGKTFTEKEMNEQLNKLHTFEDPATLRRELYNNKFIDRDPYGYSYWVEDVFLSEDELLKKYE